MKTHLKANYSYILAALFIVLGATSCKKEVSGSSDTDATLATTSTSSTIAVATDGTGSSSGSSSDSVYLINPCAKGTSRDSVASSALPSSIQTYLTTHYSGYVFTKAFATKDSTGAVLGYVVVINFNGKPVGLQFKADGTFVKVLEQRERGDINNGGWHLGGRFENRGGGQKDTVALASLLTEIKTYMTTNYGGDTLLRAFKVSGGNYLVISKNNGLFATLFTKTGVFVGRVSLTAVNTLVTVIDATLPSAATTYLTTTFPNYVLNKAVSVTISGTLKGYIALIDANGTRYCVTFDASGNFVATRAIW